MQKAASEYKLSNGDSRGNALKFSESYAKQVPLKFCSLTQYYRCVFRTPSNIYDEAFYDIS